MEKVARKPSSDPAQEKLRARKDVWNKEVSEFIDGIKHLKKMINGFPSKYHMEKSKIQEPLPTNTSDIIGALATAYKDIAVQGNDIVKDQLNYSKTRRKKAPKSLTPAPTAPAAPDLSTQLASEDYNLVAEATNPMSRFLSKLKGPWFGDSPEVRARRYRLTMLNLTVKLDKKLNLLESEIMGKNAQSIFKSGQLFFGIEDDVSKLEAEYVAYMGGVTPQEPVAPTAATPAVPTTPTAVTAPFPTGQGPLRVENLSVTPLPEKATDAPVEVYSVDYVAGLVRDFNHNRWNFKNFNEAIFSSLRGLCAEFAVQQKLGKVSEAILPKIVKNYNALLADMKAKLGVEGSSFEELKKNKVASEVTAPDKMNKFAQRTMKKWIGKLKHFLSSDETTAKRHDILEIVERCRSRVEGLADSLEDDINSKLIEEEIKQLKSEVEAMKIVITPLLQSIKGLRFDKPFIDLLQGKKLLDYNMDLPKEQKLQLEKKLEQAQLRDLVEMNRRKK